MRPSRTVAHSLLALPLALALAACGSPAKPAPPAATPAASAAGSAQASPSQDSAALAPNDLLTKAKRVLSQAETLKLDTSTTSGGEKDTAHYDIGQMAGNCTGSAAVNDIPTLDFVRKPQQVWVRLQPAYLAQHAPGPAGDRLRGKYLTGPSGNADLGKFLDLCNTEFELDEILWVKGQATAGTPTTLDGQPVIALTVDEGDGTSATVLVAAQGTPYPLKVTHGQDTDVFSGFGLPVDVQEPPADSTIDYSTLSQLPQLLSS